MSARRFRKRASQGAVTLAVSSRAGSRNSLPPWRKFGIHLVFDLSGRFLDAPSEAGNLGNCGIQPGKKIGIHRQPSSCGSKLRGSGLWTRKPELDHLAPQHSAALQGC